MTTTYQTIIDLSTDAGFETLADIIKEGGLDSVAGLDVDLALLAEKQAYASSEDFASPNERLFSIATPIEAFLSARYAEKCANLLPVNVVENIDAACILYGLPVISQEKIAALVSPEYTRSAAEADKVSFNYETEETESLNKYAGLTEYGTELNMCLYARANLYPEHADDLGELAKLASVLSPADMVSIISEFDAGIGADVPWIATQVGSPEYAVFEKKANLMTIDLGMKKVAFEAIAENEELLRGLGISLDFDMHDPYTIKVALEGLPQRTKDIIAKVVG